MSVQVSQARLSGENPNSEQRVYLVAENGVRVRHPHFPTNRDKLDNYMAFYEELSRRTDMDWPALLGNQEADPAIWRQPIPVTYGEHKYVTDVGRAEICLGALAFMCMQRLTTDTKDHWWINLTDFKFDEALGVRARNKSRLLDLHGIQLEYDGGSSDRALRDGARRSGYLVNLYSSTSHGKSSEVIVDYTEWAAKHGKPRLPTNESMAEYLNRDSPHGPAYRDVVVDFYAAGKQAEDGRWGFESRFAPQHRLRGLVPFGRPIPGELLKRLLSFKNGIRLLGERIEQDVFGFLGADPSGFRVTQPAYLPATIEGSVPREGFEPFCEVIGHTPYDAVPVAEALVAELEAKEAERPKPSGETTRKTCTEVPRGLSNSLRGVQLASLIAQQHPELLWDDCDAGQAGPWIDGDPLNLAGCPFSDGHSVRRGEDDGAIYVYDPNGQEYMSPYIGCWHRSCADRTTREFVNALIENGSLTAEAVYQNAEYRDVYEYRYDGPSTHDGHNLKAFLAGFGKTFLIEKLLADKGLVATQCRDGGVLTTDGQYARDPGQDRGFALGRDRLESLIVLLQGGKIEIADLSDARYGGGSFSSRGSASRRNLRVVDKNGRGLDVEVFQASMIAKAGRLDFARLSELSGTQIASDVTPEQLAGFVEQGRITVEHLIECALTDGVADKPNPYLDALRELAKRKERESLLQRDVDAALGEIAKKFGAKQKAIEADFARVVGDGGDSSTAIPGLLSAEDSALVEPLRNYVRDFAIINTGGKGVVLNLTEPDLSKATMGRDDFEFLYRNDWFEVQTEDGIKTIYPAKQFLAKPLKDAQVYRGGLVFKPSGTVGPDQYNLYRGMLIEPDESGSYEMFKALVRDVWVQGDEAAYEWVMEWFMHIVAHPGEKVGTSLAIRGKYGDGKSIATETLMNSILGDMLLRVANQKLILGDFNESMIGKLLIVLEEAAFAGDKAAFDRMKELITGPRVVINPKHKAPITVDNHARMMVVSNHSHFMHLKPGDRRYTVLESSDAWQGSNKYAALIEEWNDGGAARFVHDSLNHSFRRFDDRRQLVINSNLKTKAAVNQMAHSRSALEKCIVAFLLRGDFKSASRNGIVILQGPDGGSDALPPPVWCLDKELRIPSHNLQDAVTIWLREFNSQAAQHEATLHTIIATLEQYIGKTHDSRQKATEDGKRVQQPTLRLLPARRDAILHAREHGMITEVELLAALPDGAPELPGSPEPSA